MTTDSVEIDDSIAAPEAPSRPAQRPSDSNIVDDSNTVDDSTDSTDSTDSADKPGGTLNVWPDFKAWLKDNGVQSNTSETYCVQVRRLLREVEPLTSEGLETWGNRISARLRTPFRSSWRRYRQFILFQYGMKLPDFPSSKTDSGDTTDILCRAISLCIASGLTPTELEGLTTRIERGAKWKALSEINARVASDQLYVVLSENGTLALVPSNAFNALRTWGGETPWLIPMHPGALFAMPASKIGRLGRGR